MHIFIALRTKLVYDYRAQGIDGVKILGEVWTLGGLRRLRSPGRVEYGGEESVL